MACQTRGPHSDRTLTQPDSSLPPPQIEEVCGDLYPSKNEREVILSAIQAFCGPPEGKVAGMRHECLYTNTFPRGNTSYGLVNVRMEPHGLVNVW